MAKYKFQDIAFNSTEKKKPVEEDKYTYLGLEHLDPCNLTVSRYGSDVAPKGEKLIMKKGDVLFGKRRAYQKKVAIAPFDGIFSAHGMVLRPKIEVVTERFFPFFIASDYFLDTAIQISVGSLSPTVNWGTLKNVEFNLPDLNEQEKLAEILWAANDTKEAYKKLLSLTDDLVKAQFIDMFGDPVTNPREWEEYTLQALIENNWITYHLDGNHGSLYPRAAEFVDTGVTYISANCIVDGKVNFLNAKYLSPERAAQLRKGIAKNNDVLFAHNATVGPVAILETAEEKVLLGTSLTAYRCDDSRINPYYLKAYMESEAFIMQYTSEMKQTTRNQVPITRQRKYYFIIPPIELQNQFAEFVRQAGKSKSELKQTVSSLESVIKSLMQQHIGWFKH